MEQELKRIFRKGWYNPEKDLTEKVWMALALRNKRIANIRLWFFSVLGFASMASLVPVFKILLNDFARSGFYEYLSLAFSHSESVFSYLRELLLTLAESLPVVSIISTLALFFIFLLSVRYIIRQVNESRLVSMF